jgi:pilus assembly protein Flp/PilA
MIARLISGLRRFAADRTAVTSLEYGIISSMIGITIIQSLGSLGSHLTTVFTTIATHL